MKIIRLLGYKALLCIMLLLSTTMIAQEGTEVSIHNNGNVKVSGEFIEYVRVYRGIVFHEQKGYVYHYQLKCCNNVNVAFFINGIPISEQNYVRLILSKKEMDLENCYYTENYYQDSISQINIFANARIPICIDGIEYRYGDALPLKELEGKELIFKKEERLLRKNRIIIQTN